MPTNELSPNRNYPVPVAGNFISYDFPRIRTALLAIDTDVAGLLTSVAGRALTVHSHAIADVTGLQAALDAKHPNTWRPALDDLTDVNAPAPTNGQYLRRVGGEWVPASIAGLDAAVITSGVFDAARIPVLTGQAPIVSSGGLADLTSPQQAAIIAGSIVMTTDGFRWAYTGSGSKTDAGSYIQISDITPEWAVVANKPSTFPPSAHTHPISEVSGLQAALDAKAALAGNTFTGDQTISKATPILTLNKAAPGQFNLIRGRTNNSLRWDIILGDDSLEGGGNAGSQFAISRYDDAGAFLAYAMTVRRSDGYSTIPGVLEIGAANAGHSALIKRHWDAGSVGGLLQLEATPGSAMAGTLQIRQSGDGLQILEGGGSQRGANLQITDCPAGAAAALTHTGNIGAHMASVPASAVGSYGFMRDAVGGTEGNTVAGSSLQWSDHSAHSSGGSVTGTWRRHGRTVANGHVTLFQRIA